MRPATVRASKDFSTATSRNKRVISEKRYGVIARWLRFFSFVHSIIIQEIVIIRLTKSVIPFHILKTVIFRQYSDYQYGKLL